MPRNSQRRRQSIDAWQTSSVVNALNVAEASPAAHIPAIVVIPEMPPSRDLQRIPNTSSVVNAFNVAEAYPAVPIPAIVVIPEVLPASRDLLQITARKLGIPTYRDGQVHYRKSITCTLKSYQKFMEESYADI